MTGIDSDNFGNATRTYVGKSYDYGSTIATWYIDHVIISTKYIGI
jgi:hypothetical protein